MSDPPSKPGFYKVELNKTVWEVPEKYTSLSPVGSGAYGQVCSAHIANTSTKVAIKKLARPFQSAIHAKRTYRELRMLKHMKHENIIGLLDVFTPTTTLEDFEDVYLVTALMGADLNNIVKTQSLSDDHVQFLVYQMLRGLKYVHSAGIIHRDLKPSNIAVNEDCELRVLDFGLARQADDEMTGYVATRWYRAPEIMLNWMHYNQTVDVWAVGCIMAEMLTGRPLFPGATIDMWSVGCIMAELMTGRTLFPGTDPHIDQLTRIMALVGTPSPALLSKITSSEPLFFREEVDDEEQSIHSIVQSNLSIATTFHAAMIDIPKKPDEGATARHPHLALLPEQFFMATDQLNRIMDLCGKPKLDKIRNKELKRTMHLVGTPDPMLLKKIKSEEARRYIASLPTMKKRDFKTVFSGANHLAIDLLERMLDLDPDTRITAEEALAHPYLAQYADPTDEPSSDPYDQSFEEKDLLISDWKKLVYDEVQTFIPPDPEEMDQ